MRSLFQNFGQKILAFISALALWIFLMSVQNAFYELPDNINIEVNNLNELYTVSDNLQGVKIKINSQPDKIKKVSSKDFQASIDLSGLAEGTHNVPVKVETNLTDVTILKIEPANVTVTLEPVKEKELPIVLEIKGKPASGYEVVNSYPVESKMIVRGGSNLASATQIKAILQLNGSEISDLNQKVTFQVVNILGEELQNFTVPTEEISAVVEIKKGKVSKTINVSAKISEEMKAKYQGKIQVVPSQVVIKGSEDVLKNIASLETESVNDEEVKEGTKVTKKIILPEGVELKDNESPTVIINIF